MAQAIPAHVLHRHEDRRTRLQGGEGGTAPLAGSTGRGPRRLAAIAQPGGRHRMGVRVARGRRSRGSGRGARGRTRPLHRRHGAWALDRSHAPSFARAIPVRLGVAPVQLPTDARRTLFGRTSTRSLRSAQEMGWLCRRSSRSRSRHGTVDGRRRRPGTSRSPIRRTSTSRCIGCSAVRECSSTRSATSISCRWCCRRPSGSPGRAPSDELMNELVRRRSLTPLFV